MEELILAADSNHTFPNVVYEVYTLKNGQAVSVTRSKARERYFLLNDGRFLMEGSGSAMSSTWITYQFNGESLMIREQIRTSDQPHDMADFAPYYDYCGVICGPIEPIVYDEAARTIERWEKAVTLPSLTPIS